MNCHLCLKEAKRRVKRLILSIVQKIPSRPKVKKSPWNRSRQTLTWIHPDAIKWLKKDLWLTWIRFLLVSLLQVSYLKILEKKEKYSINKNQMEILISGKSRVKNESKSETQSHLEASGFEKEVKINNEASKWHLILSRWKRKSWFIKIARF